MPWYPTFRRLPDQRFDPYRNRCAALYRAGALVGHVLVLTDHGAYARSGHLWWTRWDPDYEYLQPLVQMLDGADFDQPVEGAGLEEELDHWRQNKFPLRGELLDLEWLTRDEAIRVAPGVFDVSYRLSNDQIVWSFN